MKTREEIEAKYNAMHKEILNNWNPFREAAIKQSPKYKAAISAAQAEIERLLDGLEFRETDALTFLPKLATDDLDTYPRSSQGPFIADSFGNYHDFNDIRQKWLNSEAYKNEQRAQSSAGIGEADECECKVCQGETSK